MTARRAEFAMSVTVIVSKLFMPIVDHHVHTFLDSETLAFLCKNRFHPCEPGLYYAVVGDGTTTCQDINQMVNPCST
jgi:hypothetical protein